MSMENYPAGTVWEHFRNICGIPHPSGHEEKLAEFIRSWGRARDFEVRRDAAGNIKLTRRASPGCEGLPRIVLQGHLDMVPFSADGKMNFLTDPVTVVREGDWLTTGGVSTLGADNGVGLAMALAALEEAEEGGELSAVFTVSEETGLSGAAQLEASFLDCDCLLNLDSETEGELVVGCAGGAKVRAEFQPPTVAPPAGHTGARLEVSGLKGGHSGSDIDKNRGNALAILFEIISEQPELSVASLEGGFVGNAIPASAGCLLATPDLAALISRAEPVIARHRAALGENGAALAVKVAPAPLPAAVWEREFTRRLCAAVLAVPTGVIEHDDRWQVPAASNNLAVAKVRDGKLEILCSQRAQADLLRREVTEKIKRIFLSAGAEVAVGEVYPGWTPDENSTLLATAAGLFAEHCPKPATVRVIHAGLECGTFAEKHPNLQMISFGPELLNAHSAAERVSISSTERVYGILKALIAALWRQNG